MTRTDIIRHLALRRGCRSYLEIGVGTGATFVAVPCERKVGVDPGNEYPVEFRMTSDDFFARNREHFDLIFIDGYHEEQQVLRDVEHALACLNPGGLIVCHDINPAQEDAQRSPLVANGTCWKAWVRLRATRSDLSMTTVDTDHGCGIIERGAQTTIRMPEVLDWKGLRDNRTAWLNLISIEDFLHRYV